MTVVAERGGEVHPPAASYTGKSVFADEILRFRKWFYIDTLTKPMMLSWKLKSFESSLEKISHWHFIKRFFYYLSAYLFGVFYNKRSVIIRPIEAFATKAPIEIQYRDQVELLIR